MKNMMMITILFGGFFLSMAQAQTCVTPCPPECCVTSCCTVKGSATSVALMPGNNASTTTCTPEQLAACMAVCTPEQISACQAGKKVSKREAKEWQKMYDAQVKAGCLPASDAAAKSETTIGQAYQQAPKPIKS